RPVAANGDTAARVRGGPRARLREVVGVVRRPRLGAALLHLRCDPRIALPRDAPPPRVQRGRDAGGARVPPRAARALCVGRPDCRARRPAPARLLRRERLRARVALLVHARVQRPVVADRPLSAHAALPPDRRVLRARVRIPRRPARARDRARSRTRAASLGTRMAPVTAANDRAVAAALACTPRLVGVKPAIDVIPGMTPDRVLHAAPAAAWEELSPLLRTALTAAAELEGLTQREATLGAAQDFGAMAG